MSDHLQTESTSKTRIGDAIAQISFEVKNQYGNPICIATWEPWEGATVSHWIEQRDNEPPKADCIDTWAKMNHGSRWLAHLLADISSSYKPDRDRAKAHIREHAAWGKAVIEKAQRRIKQAKEEQQ